MDLSDRLELLMIGCFVGFILGYIVRALREIKEELHDVDTIIHKARERDEEGSWRHPDFTTILLLVVVAITAYAAFASQRATNQVKDVQAVHAQVTLCNKQYLEKTIVALNSRTGSIEARADANLQLQIAQNTFFTTILKHPNNDQLEFKAFHVYIDAQNHFIHTSIAAKEHLQENPYPTAQELDSCLAEAMPLALEE